MLYLDGLFDSLYQDDGSYKAGVRPGASHTIAAWRGLLSQMPKTAHIARNILSIMVTSNPSERFFSRAKFVSRNRERLTPARLEQLVLSSANMVHFERALPGLGCEEEEAEDAFVGDAMDDGVDEEKDGVDEEKNGVEGAGAGAE